MPELTAEAKAAKDKLVFAGGRHRKRATEILYENSKEMISKLEDQIARLKESTNGNREAIEKKIQNKEKMLDNEIALKERLSIWGIIVYDEGEEQIIGMPERDSE